MCIRHWLLSPEDEFADYERWGWANLDMTEKKTPAMLPADYVRSALKNGLAFGAEKGVNPFKLGFVGGRIFIQGCPPALMTISLAPSPGWSHRLSER